MEQEIKNGTYTIPEGFIAKIEDGKIIVEKAESDDEKIRKEILHLIGYIDIPEKARNRWLTWLRKQKEQKPVEWNEESDKLLNYAISMTDDAQVKKFLESLRYHPKQEWSEEDEDMRYKATAVLNKLCASNEEFVWAHSTLVKVFYWLKSLRPQPHWKPSEEQMEWLESAVKLSTNKPHIHGIIISLYEQLKRL